MRDFYVSIFAAILALNAAVSFAGPPLLLQKPALSKSQIAFVYADDIWMMDRDGGEAKRLTSGPGAETDPHFSPDGTLLAFTGEYDGNTDIYVVSSSGGVPKRLTHHPSHDRAAGWTQDGKRVLFASDRHSPFGNNRLFTLPVDGGFPEELPLPTAEEGSYSPDGTHLAYVPTIQWQRAWKRYRGGQTKPIWIADLADSSVVKLPRENSNDFNPMWMGDTIFFLSDRNGPIALFAFDCATKQVRQAVPNEGLDFKSASAGPDGIVIEQFGSLRLYDLKSGNAKTLAVSLTGDMAEVRPRFKSLDGKDIESGKLSPTGQRAVFEARGEIFSVPAEKGNARNLTRTPGVAERDPAWSPDGKWIAHFSEESGEYALHLREQSGLGEVQKIPMGTPPSFFYSPVWSPDSKKIACTDKRGNLWRLDLESRKPFLVDTNTFGMTMDPPEWSTDSQWLVYVKKLRNRMNAIFIHSLEDGKNRQITDGMSDAAYPCFDASGKYLYFAASTDLGPLNGWGDLSTMNRPATRSLYLAVLDSKISSPLAPESDEEKVEAKKEDPAKDTQEKAVQKVGKKKKKQDAEKSKDTNAAPDKVKIDFENLGQRILSLPLPARNYVGLASGKSNILFALEGPPLLEEPAPSFLLQKFDMTKRKAEKFAEGIRAFALSQNREKMLLRKGDSWIIAGTDAPAKGDEKALNFADARLAIDPPVEWRQMYRETWRIERDFLYAPNHHGLDLDVASRRYAPYLEGLASRSDLNYLFEEMLGELTIGHMFVGGGDTPKTPKVSTGLLGADYRIENGRYRFARIYDGENWNLQLRAPLTEPGIQVAAGEYLLAVDGRDLSGIQNIFEFFVDKADRIVVLRVGKNADGKDSREIRVRPVGGEHDLRNRAWVEDNRRKVQQLSEGRLAYVYLPDTAKGGYDNFNRYYFAQADKDGFIIDERFNGGGYLADYVVDYLRRPVMNYIASREGEDTASPWGANAGPKVMIINEFAGSGGDALPWYFRKAGIGTLVGKRTWGGLVGIGGYPSLIDGGSVMAPHWAIYGTQGEWEVENQGIAPDIEVELDPKAWRSGKDLQLEKAVEVALESLRKNPPLKARRPAYPNYHNDK